MRPGVGGGIPILRAISESLQANSIESVYGIIKRYDKLYPVPKWRMKAVNLMTFSKKRRT